MLSVLMSRLSWKVAAIAAGCVAVVALGLSGFYWMGTVARDSQLAKKDAQIVAVKGDLMRCQTDLLAADQTINDQNEAVRNLSIKAMEAEKRAKAEREKNATQVKRFESRIAWLKSQKLSDEQCPGVRSMAVEYLASERKEAGQ